MEKRRIVGVSYKATPKKGNELCLWDNKIVKIYYLPIDGLDLDSNMQVPYTTIDEFIPETGEITSPNNYLQMEQYVNCFLGKATVSSDLVPTQLYLPRLGANTPIFNVSDTLRVIGRVQTGSMLLYVNEVVGVLVIDGYLTSQLSNSETIKMLLKPDGRKELEDRFRADIAEKLQNCLSISLLCRDHLGKDMLSPGAQYYFRHRDKELSTHLGESIFTFDSMTPEQIKNWVTTMFMSLYKTTNICSSGYLTPVENLCKKYASFFKEDYTSEELTQTTYRLLEYAYTPVYDEAGNATLGIKKELESEQFKLKHRNILSIIEQYLSDYFHTVKQESRLGEQKVDTAQTQETAFKSTLDSTCTLMKGKGVEGQERALQSATGAFKESRTGQAEMQKGESEQTANCVHNSEQSELLSNEQQQAPQQETQETQETSYTPLEAQEALRKLQESKSRFFKQHNIESLHEDNLPAEQEYEDLDTQKQPALEQKQPALEQKQPDLEQGQIESEQVEPALEQSNCISDCPLCKGSGYVLTAGLKMECPNHVQFVAEQKRSQKQSNAELLSSKPFSKAATKYLIPKKYYDRVWDSDLTIDTMRTIAKENNMDYNINELQNYKKGLSVILSILLQGKLPDYSYMISSPNGSGKTTFAYTLIKLLIIKGISAVPYITLMELAELRKRYLMWAGNLSQKEISRNRVSEQEIYTAEFLESVETSEPQQLTESEMKRYIEALSKTQYRYTDFLNTPLLLCSMSQSIAQLPLEISTLKAILDYRAKKGKSTIVFTECQVTSLNYEIYYGENQEGLFTILTNNEELASFDRMLSLSVKPVRKKF